MNAKQMGTWKEIVRQCKSRLFGSINVASNVRGDAILAADALVELVTPELMELLERLADYARRAAKAAKGSPDDVDEAYNDEEITRALAARIKEALEDTRDEAL